MRNAADVASRGWAQAVFELVPGAWSEPVESGFGWHLVFVDDLVPGRAPDLSEVEDQVAAGWVAARREEFKDEAYKVMRAKYEVILPDVIVGENTAGKGS